MKKTFIGIMALAISMTAFVSCELDAPEINFSQTTTVEMDFTEVINAIKDQTLSITQKLEILENAMKAQNTTLEQKLAAIETAVKEGVADIAAKQDLIKAAIDALGTDMDAAVKAIEDAIKSQTTSLETKLDLIETAVKNGVADIIEEQELVKDAIIGSLDEHFTETKESLDAVNKALTKLGVEEGIYPESNRDTLYMHPTAWDLLYKDEDLTKAFSRMMSLKQIPITVSNHQVGSNWVVGGVVLESKQAIQDGDTPILFALPIKTATANNPKPVEAVMYSYTKYVISAKLNDKDAETWEMTGQYQYSTDGATYPYFNAGGTLNADTGFYDFKINLVREKDHRQNITAVMWPMLRKKQQQ